MTIETDYKRLLTRKRYNGKDLGKTVIYSLAYNNYCSRTGKPPKLPTLSNDELIARAESLTDSQRLECNKYIRFSSAVKICLNFSKELYTRFMKDYYFLQLNLKGIADSNIQYTRAALQPLIVTSKKAASLKRAALQAKAAASLNYADLFFLALEYFLMLEAQPLLLPADIREELDQLQQKPTLDRAGQEAAKRKITNDDRAAAARLIFEGKAAILKKLEKLDTANYIDFELMQALDLTPLYEAIATSTDLIQRTLDNHNYSVYFAYQGMQGTPEQRKEHRKIFKETFRPLFLTAWEPHKQETKAAKTMFEAAIDQPREIIIELSAEPKRLIEGLRVMLDAERTTERKNND